MVCGDKHLRHLCKEFSAHYHEERPHQGRGNVPLSVADQSDPSVLQFPSGKVECRERLGGLLRHYYRSAA